MAEDRSVEHDDFDDDEVDEEELLELVKARSVKANVERALEAAEMNWHRHGGDDLKELEVILSVLQELASKSEKPTAPLGVTWVTLQEAAAKVLADLYIEAEVAEDLSVFRRMLAPDEDLTNPVTVLSSDTVFAEVQGLFLNVFGEVEEERLLKLLHALRASCNPVTAS
jgi:hypothetical protein